MGEVLDNLFGVLPVVLAVVWILRLLSNRRSRQQRGREATPGAPRPPSNPAREKSAPESQGQKLVTKLDKAVKAALDAPPPRALGEDSYDRTEEGRITPIPVAEALQKIEVTHLDTDASPKAVVPTTRMASSLERIDALPPIARGMIWSIILDDPPGSKGF